MDNLTHSLVGVLLARAGLQRLTPKATAISVVAANVPDIDIITATSAIDYLNYHRHLTHSLPAVPLMATLALLLVAFSQWILRRPASELLSRRCWLVAFIAAISHPLLDLANTYGVRLWLPFSGRWSNWDILFIIDLWVWGLLLLMTLSPMLGRLVQREIGVTPTRGRLAARAGLLLLVVFIGGKALLHQRAIMMLDSFLYDGEAAVRLAAFPAPFGWNPFLWAGLVETESFYQTPELNVWGGRFDPTSGPRFYKEAGGPALEAALDSEVGADYARFAQYMFAQVQELPDGYVVELSDFRFRQPGRVRFQCTIGLDKKYRVTSQEFSF